MQLIARPVVRCAGPEQDVKLLIKHLENKSRILWEFKGRSIDARPFVLVRPTGRTHKKRPLEIISGGFLRDQQRSTSRIAERALS